MNRYPKAFFIIAFACLSLVANSQKSIKAYIKKYQSIAVAKAGEHGIPASVILGVSIVESAAGQSAVCKSLNNFFGVKGKNRNSEKKMGYKSAYKEYKSAAESFEDFCRMLAKKKFYPKLKGNTDYKAWLKQMTASSYTSARQKWVNDVTRAIKKHDLDDLDKKKDDEQKTDTAFELTQ